MERGSGLVAVCDDTEQIRRLIRMNLELEGYEVSEAAEGEGLLDLLREDGARRPGVIILDAQMQPKDGWWAIHEIRADEKLSEIPVIMVTASVQQHDRIQSEAAGLDAFVSKPFDPEFLLELIEGFMAKGRAFTPEL